MRPMQHLADLLSLPKALATCGVSNVPGQTQLTLTPAGANSSAAVRVIPTTPCLAAL
jgi:hypothetical protein